MAKKPDNHVAIQTLVGGLKEAFRQLGRGPFPAGGGAGVFIVWEASDAEAAQPEIAVLPFGHDGHVDALTPSGSPHGLDLGDTLPDAGTLGSMAVEIVRAKREPMTKDGIRRELSARHGIQPRTNNLKLKLTRSLSSALSRRSELRCIAINRRPHWVLRDDERYDSHPTYVRRPRSRRGTRRTAHATDPAPTKGGDDDG